MFTSGKRMITIIILEKQVFRQKFREFHGEVTAVKDDKIYFRHRKNSNKKKMFEPHVSTKEHIFNIKNVIKNEPACGFLS